MSLRPWCAILIAACLFAVPLEGAPAVADNPPLMSMRGGVSRVRAADFDGDGKLDFAALVYEAVNRNRTLYVYRGNGDGTFREPLLNAMPQRAATFDVALLDGDAIPDVAFAGGDTQSATKLQLARGNGDGTFSVNAAEVSAPSCWLALTLADMTSDGRADAVCGLTVIPSLGNGSFGSPIVNGSQRGGTVVDANGDGRRDVVLVETGTLYLGQGNGTFFPTVPLPWALQNESRNVVAMGNFDGSGWADLAFVYESLSVSLAAGGSYGTPVKHGFVEASAIATPDLNGDGRADIIAGGAYQLSAWIMGAGGVPSPRRIYATAGAATTLTTGDFDGDGSIDVLVAGEGDGYSDHAVISLLRGSPAGALQAMRAYGVTKQWPDGGASGGKPVGAGLADVTGDGKPDLITVAAEIPSIDVFPGQDDGTFADAPQRTALPFDNYYYLSARTMHVADFDEDGAADVMVAFSSRLECFFANGDGTYRIAPSFILEANGIGDSVQAVGDFNGDGHADFVYRVFGGLRLVPGNGDGTFAPPIHAAHDLPSGFAAGDVDNDGRGDLVFAGMSLLGNASGTFTQVATGVTHAPTLLADMDGDGKREHVFFDAGHEQITIHKGNGDGTFGAPHRLAYSDAKPGLRRLTQATSGDFNGDGDTDLAFGPMIFLGDGNGAVGGYARMRDPGAASECGAGDADANGSADLLCVDPVAHHIGVFRTQTAASLDLPLALAIESAPASAAAGSWINVRVRAVTTPAGLAPTGAVIVSIGGKPGGLAELVDGIALVTVWVGASPGALTLTARYGGDDVYAAADVSQPISVSKATTTISLWVQPGAPTTRDGLRFTGSVHSGLPGITGTVSFFLDGQLRRTVDGPAFEFIVGPQPSGYRQVRIEYSGDDAHLPGVAHDYVTVNKPYIAMNVAVDPPGNALAGQPITFTITFPEEPQLTGQVTVRGAEGVQVQAPIAGGTATVTTSQFPPMGESILVTYLETAVYRLTTVVVPYRIADAPIAPGPTSFHLITPCRVWDSRMGIGPIPSKLASPIWVARRCGIPNGAKAVAANVTVVAPTNTGYLTLYPGVSPLPHASTLNYRPGKTRANSVIMPLSAGGMLQLYNSGPGYVDAIVDVTGYFQ